MRFSVIMPVHNGERYLRECLDSVAAQSFVDWECLCVDDGSTDATPMILDDYAARDSRFVVIRKSCEGVSAARNAALDRASGEYVCFVDADDVLDGKWFAAAETLISRFDPDLVRLDRVLWHVNTPLPNCRPSTYENVWEGEEAMAWGLRTFLRQGQSWLNFVRRSTIGELRYPVELAVREDVVFLAQLSLRLRKVCESDYGGYFYRLHPNSAWHRVRQLSDAVAFPRALLRLAEGLPGNLLRDGAVRGAYSRSLLANLEEWVGFADKQGRSHDVEVIAATRNAVASVLFSVADLDETLAAQMQKALKSGSLASFARTVRWRWNVARFRRFAKRILGRKGR